jgi:hypothetical protein
MQHALDLNPKARPDYTKTNPSGSSSDSGSAGNLPVGADGMVHLKICPDSGLIATNHCPHWRSRSFRPEDAPTGVCNLHPGIPLSGGASTTRTRRRRTDADTAPSPASARVAATSATPAAVSDASYSAASADHSVERPAARRTEVAATATPEPDANPPPRAAFSAAPRPSPTVPRAHAAAPRRNAVPVRNSQRPRFVTLCADSGLRATAACPRTITRRLTASTPSAYCNIHGG